MLTTTTDFALFDELGEQRLFERVGNDGTLFVKTTTTRMDVAVGSGRRVVVAIGVDATQFGRQRRRRSHLWCVGGNDDVVVDNRRRIRRAVGLVEL